MAPLWKPASSLIAKVHTVTGQVKPIGQRGRPALPTGVIIHDASTLLLDLPGDSISRYKEPNKEQKRASALVHTLLIPRRYILRHPRSRAGMTMMFKGRNIPVIPEAALAAIRYLLKSFTHSIKLF